MTRVATNGFDRYHRTIRKAGLLARLPGGLAALPDGVFAAMPLTDYEIAGLLRDYQQLRTCARELRAEMLRLVVEELGVRQKVAQQTSLETFLDGYLLGQEMAGSCRKVLNYEIAGLLSRSQQLKQSSRKLRSEMMRVAVEQFGMEQNAALQANLDVFFDGYLVAQGTLQAWRKTGT